MGFGDSLGGAAAGYALGTIDGVERDTRAIRQEVAQINRKVSVLEEDYRRTIERFDALAERFRDGRGLLLGTYRSKLAYRQLAHDLSGKPYEEIDTAAEALRPNFDKEVEEAELKQIELDRKVGV